MIKAVIFDWFNTLARYEPPRELVHSRALKEFGIDVVPAKLVNPLLTADKFFFDENILNPVRSRSAAEQDDLYTRYEEIVMSEAGLTFAKTLPRQVLHKGQEIFGDKLEFVLFEDVLTGLEALRERKLILGLLSNFAKNMEPLVQKLGMTPYIDFVTTPHTAGADKPDPKIFYAALKQAGVTASEAIYIGDQIKVDVAGAIAAGIKPLLIDRYNINADYKGCPVVTGIAEIPQYL